MIKNTYGQTGIEVSAIGFGGMRFPSPYDIDENAALVKRAYDLGVNYFDTAPGYCDDKSESIFGAAIKEINKTRNEKPFYVSSKSMESEPERIRANLEKSLQRLNVDSIDFYHVWCIISRDVLKDRKAKGALKEFEKIKDQGLAKNICISTHMNGEDTAKMLQDYEQMFAGVLLGYSAMNFAYRDKGIQAASELNKGVVVMNPLGGGLIPKNPDKFAFLKSSQDETVVQAALKFLLSDKRITTSIVGFENEKQIQEAVSAAENFKSISTEKIKQIRQSLEESFNELCTACQYCDHCPQGIPIPKLMDSYNSFMLSDGNKIDMLNKMKYHWGMKLEDDYLRACNECGKCEELCTQQLPIRQRLKEIRQAVDEYLANEKAKS